MLLPKLRLLLPVCLLALLLAACASPPPAADVEDASASWLKPHVPAIDGREHRFLELPNGLKVLVISDPETDQGAAALSVGVGSLADPPGREGLAHFLEHMLFLGTEKYPEPDEYGDFISRHGGRHNAYTAQDHTNYFFEIAAGQLEGGLDRFAQFFVAPLFDADYVAREVNAVHSEYMLQMREDGWRTFMTQKQAMNPDHPAARFNIGSLETLADRPDDPIRETLLDFYAAHYSADRMGLVILGREDVATLAGWAREMFSAVPRQPVAESEPELPLFRSEDLPALLEIQPVRELRTLQISFPLPPIDPHYRVAPGDYLANLIGHEGEGSVHAWLTERGWIDGLAAGASHYGRENAVLNVSITLTRSGLEHWQEVAAAVFAYIDLIRDGGIDAERYREQQDLTRLAFDFREKGAAFGYVRSLAQNLLIYPPEDVIRAPFAMELYDPALIRSMLDELKPQNALVTVIAPEVETDREEPYFGVRHRLRPLAGDTLALWRAPGEHPGLALPAANPFVPERLDLIADSAAAPARIQSAAPLQVWHQPDRDFNVPRATVRIDLRTPAAAGARGQVLGNLYARLVTDELNTYAYPARLAGLSYSLRGDRSGLSLSLGGFDDKLEVLLDVVLDTMVGIEPRPERFEHFRSELIRELRNELQRRPYERTMAELRRLLESPEYAIEQLIDAAGAVTLDDLGRWQREALTEPGILALLHGNLDAQRAEALALLLRERLDARAPEVGPEPRLVRLSNTRVQREVSVDHDDAAFTRYVQGRDQSFEERARFGLLGRMLGTPYFNDLRTERQLGYVVSAGAWVRVNTPGVFFVVQSPVASPAAVEAATLEFLEAYRERLARMSVAEFESEREGLLTRLLERDQNLNSRGARMWRDLQDQVLDFDSREQLAEAIRQLDLETFREFYATFMALSETQVATLWTPGRIPDEGRLPSGEAVDDIEAFKAARGSFGLQRRGSRND
ncbi:MAG: insulinase family protein [Gammaproteobacteria bacterium]|nr:insulinase family protein [Gammaproteobacteria bacterium]